MVGLFDKEDYGGRNEISGIGEVMWRSRKFLVVCLVIVAVLMPLLGWAWVIGGFEVPAKPVKVKPNPQAVVGSGSGRSGGGSVPASQNGAGAGSNFTDPVTGMEFIWVPQGCFQMGSPSGEKGRDSDEGPVHRVCLDGFWMGKYEVTQGQWQKITGNNPSRFKKGNNYPVEKVSWNDCQEFIKKLNRRSGKNFRLPTEAEWEYACRAGTTTPFSFGSTISTDQANYDGNYTYGRGRKGVYRKSTVSVGSFRPNAFGLYDMHGNVWEWCSDWYDSGYYKNSPEQNPQGASSGSSRVFRGGCWSSSPWCVRSANRGWLRPGSYFNILGFRLVSPGRR
ncbi:MAG: formylglycine-generating enzyme family protein [Pseudomonadota bacterium]|nr:formylglycine-generating enzyme family protein [Pseudomonadota bacterium]